MRRASSSATIFPERGGNPSWLPGGAELCLMCSKYTCHSHCENMSTHQQRQSMVEFVSAKKHARAYPTLEETLTSVRNVCEAAGVALPKGELVASWRAILSAVHATCCLDDGGSAGWQEVEGCMKMRGYVPKWSKIHTERNSMTTTRRRAIASSMRCGRALWHVTRLSLAEMVPEDMELALMWLEGLIDGQCRSLRDLRGPAAAQLAELVGPPDGPRSKAVLMECLAPLVTLLYSLIIASGANYGNEERTTDEGRTP